MDVTVNVMNGGEHELTVDEPAVYGDLLDRLDVNPEAAVVLVDGRPVPEDAAIDHDDVTVMRAISGGCVA